MGIQINFTGAPAELLAWPEEVTSNQADGWQDINNITCPTP